MPRLKKTKILRSLQIVWKSSPKWAFMNALVILAKGGIPMLLIYIIQMLVDVITGNKLSFGFLEIDSLWVILIIAAVVFLMHGILNAVSGVVREKHSHYIVDIVQDLIHQRTTSIDFENFDDYRFQDIYYRAVNEASYRPSRIYYGFIGLMQNSITLALIAGLFVTLHWGVLLLLLFFVVPVVFIRLKFSKRIFDFKRSHTGNERLVNYYNNILTAKQFAKELRIFNLSSIFKKRYEKEKGELRNKQFSLLKEKTVYELVIQILTALALIVILGYIAHETLDGRLTQGKMVMFYLALYRGYGFLQDLLLKISSLYEDGLFLKYFYEFIDYRVIEHTSIKEYDFPEKITNGIQIENLDFKYPNSSRYVFKNLSLKIGAGETVAVVGNNGAGKSTLVKLICGLYEPNHGKIKVDGIDLSLIKKSSIAENVSAIFQDFMLYNISAKENIWLGNIKESINSDEIKRSAEKAGVHQLIESLPNGYGTTLGTLFKDSEMLSVGEWQRIALARSFFNNAQIVMLDEPTSSLDAYTEATLIKNFESISKDKTSIVVSHRFSTIHMADRVIVLSDGGIVEDGKPSELLEKKGVFYKMVNSVN